MYKWNYTQFSRSWAFSSNFQSLTREYSFSIMRRLSSLSQYSHVLDAHLGIYEYITRYCTGRPIVFLRTPYTNSTINPGLSTCLHRLICFPHVPVCIPHDDPDSWPEIARVSAHWANTSSDSCWAFLENLNIVLQDSLRNCADPVKIGP